MYNLQLFCVVDSRWGHIPLPYGGSLVPRPFLYCTPDRGSGETRIQFWFHVARSGRCQSNCRTVPTSLPRLKKIAIVTSRNRESADYHLFSKWSMKLPIAWVQLSVLKAWARWEALLYMYANYYANMNGAIICASIITHHGHSVSGTKNWIHISPNSFSACNKSLGMTLLCWGHIIGRKWKNKVGAG